MLDFLGFDEQTLLCIAKFRNKYPNGANKTVIHSTSPWFVVEVDLYDEEGNQISSGAGGDATSIEVAENHAFCSAVFQLGL